MKKFKTNLPIILFFVTIALLIFFVPLSNTLTYFDVLWNFQSLYKMHSGALIYSDINVIDTPIFFILGNALFHILQPNLLTFHIYGALIYFAKFLLIYFIFRKLNIKKAHSILYVAFIFLQDETIHCSANYNQLALVFSLFGILLYITKYKTKFYNILQGLIIFLIFFTKQTIGVYYAIGIVLFELFDIGLHKNFFKNQFVKLASFIPLLTISLLIMYKKGNLFDFINMCFGSIFEFGSSNFSGNLNTIGFFIAIIAIIISSLYIILKVNNISDIHKMNLKFLLCISIMLSLNMLPLINLYHTIMSFTYYFILILYIVDFAFADEIFNTKKSTYVIILTVFLILYALFLKTSLHYIENKNTCKTYDKNHPFYNNFVEITDFSQTDIIQQYISMKKNEGINVIVITYEAGRYNIPLGINNGEFDMLLAGNLGYSGIEKTIEKINNMHNTEFLLFTNEDDCFYQEPAKIRDYISNNFKKNGELFNYSIYIKE